MQLLTEKSITIRRPVSTVFDYVVNLENFGQWFPAVISIESANAVAHGQVGKEYLETVTVPLKGTKKIKIQVREVQTNILFVTEGKFPPLLPRMEILFSGVDGNACKVTWRMFSRNDGLVAKLVLLPFARKVMKKRAERGVTALRQRLESL